MIIITQLQTHTFRLTHTVRIMTFIFKKTHISLNRKSTPINSHMKNNDIHIKKNSPFSQPQKHTDSISGTDSRRTWTSTTQPILHTSISWAHQRPYLLLELQRFQTNFQIHCSYFLGFFSYLSLSLFLLCLWILRIRVLTG